jgi:hypothetical protein
MTTEGGIGGGGGGGVGDLSHPVFAGPIQNVTVNLGREAVLECHVKNLKQYKVGSFKRKENVAQNDF